MRDTAPAARLTANLRWMIGIRLVAITSIVLPYLLIELSTAVVTPAFDLLYLFAGLTYGASLLYIVAMRIGLPALLQARMQFTGDLLLVTLLVYQFGSASAFSILYVAVIMTAAALVGSRAALVTSSVAWVLYAVLSIGTLQGWITAADRGGDTISVSLLLYKLAVHLVGFYGVAVLTSKLTAGVSELESELEEERSHLADLRIRHQDILESVPSGLLTTDLEGRITTLNRSGEDILGMSRNDLEGHRIDTTRLLSFDQWRGFTDDPSVPSQRNEIDIVRDGETRNIGFGITQLTSAEGSPSGWILVFQDLTRWRLLEEQIRLKDRMAAIGELAAGIAHELGNPLAAISGSVQMLSKEVEGDSPQRKLLDIILKESQRLNRTIKGFLQFARPRERSIVKFDVCRLLNENLDLLRNSHEVSEAHQLELELEPERTTISADPDQISQLFWNLARNALRAMPEGGLLRVTGKLHGDEYHMTFEDSGKGMTEDEQRRIFHPFHTGFMGGTGIGMSIVYRIVEEHGGQLAVDSAPSAGTTIRVSLPARIDVLTPIRAEA